MALSSEPKKTNEETLPKEKTEEKTETNFEALRKNLGLDKTDERLNEQQKTLDSIISELGNTNQTLHEVVNTINQAVKQGQPQAPTAAAPTTPGSPIVDLQSPEGAARVQAYLAIAKEATGIYKDFKGGGANAVADNTIQNQLVQNIIGSFTKLFQIHIDDSLMRTYQTKLPMPDWAKTQTQPTPEKIKVE